MWNRIWDKMVGRESLSNAVGPYRLSLLSQGRELSVFHKDGDSYVVGESGERYSLLIENHAGRRIEVVVSVDGRDVISGESADAPSSCKQRGYLVPAYGRLEIEGWRVSDHRVAAFCFVRSGDSYAARLPGRSNIGVICALVFPEMEAKIFRGGPYEAGAYPSASGAAPLQESLGGCMPRRRSLGTAFGEALRSSVREVPFVREHKEPEVVLGVRYGDEEPWERHQRRYCRPPLDWE